MLCAAQETHARSPLSDVTSRVTGGQRDHPQRYRVGEEAKVIATQFTVAEIWCRSFVSCKSDEHKLKDIRREFYVV